MSERFQPGDIVVATQDYNQELRKGCVAVVKKVEEKENIRPPAKQLVTVEVLLSSHPYGEGFESCCFDFRLQKIGRLE